jgi:CRP-like cAMP-binding protein
MNIVRSGAVERMAGGKVCEILTSGNYFGEDRSVLNVPSLYGWRARDATTVVQIPGDLIAEVPALRWKIFELFQQRVAHMPH